MLHSIKNLGMIVQMTMMVLSKGTIQILGTMLYDDSGLSAANLSSGFSSFFSSSAKIPMICVNAC
jgi:hypothetical protein